MTPTGRQCDACWVIGTELIKVRTTNGALHLCQQCLDDINRKNPALKSTPDTPTAAERAKEQLRKWLLFCQDAYTLGSKHFGSPNEWMELGYVLEASLDRLSAEQSAADRATAAERERIIPIMRRHLQFDNQRAVSWHEVEDCIVAILKGQP